jgi:hypothetical protein
VRAALAAGYAVVATGHNSERVSSALGVHDGELIAQENQLLLRF